jgi:hypothetical protein
MAFIHPSAGPALHAWSRQLRQRGAAALAWLRETQLDLTRELFDENGLNTVFLHARNVLSGTVIVAAGLYAAHHLGSSDLPGMWTVHIAGYVVATLGVVLLLLNLCDGLRRLARRRHHVALRVATILVYLALSIRLTQVIVYFRSPF